MTSIIYPATNLAATGQLSIQRGEGVYVEDSNGKRYLEGLAGLWCTALGYGNEEVVEAAAEQMRALTYGHMFGGRSHPVAEELGNKLAAMLPVKGASVFFGSSGSDANDTLVKMLRYYFNAIGQPGKYKIIARERAYHGVTIAAASLTGLKANHTHFDLPFEALGILRIGAPYYYREGRPGESEADFSGRCADELEQLILKEGPDTIAAFIAEPVIGGGGVIPPPAGYFAAVQEVLQRHDILMWSDEVITGFGRTGADFGATKYGIEPQLMTLAKALSSAYLPLSAAVVTGEMHEAMIAPSAEVGVFGHGYTYSGHPVACAVASKVLDIYQRDRIFEHAAKVGGYMQQKLRAFESHPLAGDVRGVGLIGAVELVADKATRRAFKGNSVGAFCQKACEERGLLLRGLGGNIMAACPPLIITESQVDELAEKLSGALDATLEYAKREGLLGAA